MVEKPILPKIT